MADAGAPDPARIEALRRRLDDAAYEHPAVDAVVVYRPDLRREDAIRLARSIGDANLATHSHAAELFKLVPPGEPDCSPHFSGDSWTYTVGKRLDDLGLEVYWTYPLHGTFRLREGESPISANRWQFVLFGPPGGNAGFAVSRRFEMLARDAAQIVLRHKGQAATLQKRWLVHLADRQVPLSADCQRRVLTDEPFGVPIWALGSRSEWWAVRLPHVFQLSRDVVQEVIDGSTDGPASEEGSGGQPPRRITKIAQAIALKRQRPELTDKAVAEEVGCDPSTLSGSADYKAARDAAHAENAKRLNRSRRNRGSDMDEYSGESDD